MSTALLVYGSLALIFLTAACLSWREGEPRRDVLLLGVTGTAFGAGTLWAAVA